MATAPQRTVSEVLQDIVGNIQELMRSEFRLAQAEIKEKAQKASRPVAMMGVGALFGIYALGFLLLGAVYALAVVVAAWLAAVIVAVVLAVVAGILVSAGRNALQKIDPVPERTVQSVKEDVQWTKSQIK